MQCSDSLLFKVLGDLYYVVIVIVPETENCKVLKDRV